MLPLQFKDNVNPFQMLLMHIIYALQESFKKSWKDCKTTKLWQTLNDEEQEKYRTSRVLIEILSGKLKPQHYEIIVSFNTIL